MSEVQISNGKRLIRKPVVLDKTGLKAPQLEKQVRQGIFPMPVQLGPRTFAWWEHEVDQYMDNLPRGRGENSGNLPRTRRAVLDQDGEGTP